MELFAVERYNGDFNSDGNSSEKESKHLEKLLQGALGRKRSIDSLNSTALEEDKDDTIRKRKKDNDIAMETTAKQTKTKTPKQKSKKSTKKRKKLEAIDKREKELDEDSISQPVDRVHTDVSVHESASGDDDGVGKEKFCSSSPSPSQMTVIGTCRKKRVPSAVLRTLPKWLANPSLFSSEVDMKNLVAISQIEGLSPCLISKLKENAVKGFFPVQKSVIPAVLNSWERESPLGRAGFIPQDICVCAPTGSGKTLAYVLPVVEILSNTTMQALEALVIVPTKDLATQVYNVFNTYVAGTKLKVGISNGLKSLKNDQHQFDSSSCINILVATPGRLVEHISSTKGFSLRYLRFFIIDEADRLLAEPYFGWLDKVYASVFSASGGEAVRSFPNCLTPVRMEKLKRPLQKLLFSATLTQNPEKLALLQLYSPRFFSASTCAEDKGEITVANANNNVVAETLLSIPSTLKESMYICNSGGKPLVLLYLLTKQSLDKVLCFTSSVDSTHRLFLLIKHFGGIVAQEFSSSLGPARRQKILNDFKCGETQIVICSDAMGRGLDVPSVNYVISYDPPVSSKTYVHRIGRTARAGKEGTAITLLHSNEVFHFKKMRKSLRKGKIGKLSVKDDELQSLMERYESALELLKADIMSAKKRVWR